MDSQTLIRGRRSRTQRRHASLANVAAEPVVAREYAYPGYADPEDAARTRTFLTGSALLHAGLFALLLLIASVAPVIQEHVIPVQLLQAEATPPPPPPPPDEEPAAAPKALAEHRNLPFAPAVQAVAPQVVNPRIVAEARPVVAAQALQMDALGSSAATPTQIQAHTATVERVSVLPSAATARASNVDVAAAAGPAVRGPIQVEGPTGPSVGPRRVEAAAVGTTVGVAPIQIGSANGSSVREGVLSNRDVVGSPDGALVISVDTAIGNSLLAGGEKTDGGSQRPSPECFQRAAVKSYLEVMRNRMYARWVLPPGVEANRKVTLGFSLDVAGSASTVSIVSAEDNALGASAVDALRAASPFPPMSDEVRCLAGQRINGIFKNPVGG